MTIQTNSGIEQRFEKSQNDLVLQTSDFSLSGLREMVENDVIDLRPGYQRRERWDRPRQSELIESFLMNVPVPPIYLSEENYGIYSIIDGKQRLTAISDYLSNSFALSQLDSFHEINGLKFRDLPKPLQNALRIRPYIRVVTLLKQTDPRLKYEVFIRLNRGGIQLNPQEIRNVAFRGALNKEIYKASEHVILRKALKISGTQSSSYRKMQDAEYVLRFLTLSKNWKSFSGNLSRSMDDYMIANGNSDAAAAGATLSSFYTAIDRVGQLWGDYAFQRWDGQRWRQQALAGLYDAQMIAALELQGKEMAHLSGEQAKILENTKNLFAKAEFEESVRVGTNTPARLRDRVRDMKGMLHAIYNS